jgi:uncharacterized membrane protein YbhN (UPF0104 family)
MKLSKGIRKKLISLGSVLFMVLVAYLLTTSLMEIQWKDVQESLSKVSAKTLVPLILLGLVNYGLLATFDLVSFRVLDLKLLVKKTFPTAFVCYAFNLNLGSLVGGLGLRYRLYSKWGVSLSEIPFLIFYSVVGNWSGHLLLVSILFLFSTEKISELLTLSSWVLIGLGLLGTSLLFFYFYCCSKGKKITFRNKKIKLPGLKLALIQLSLSLLQWTMIAFIIFRFLRFFDAEVNFPKVFFTFLLSSVAGVFTHIPAGLGVLETFFLRLDLNAPSSQILAALLCYRFVYYFFPLLVALPVYIGLELRLRRAKLA